MRKHATPTPALVIAMIALFVALGGTGYAASQVGIANHTVTAHKTKVSRGPRGLRGPRGPRGLQGAQGSLGPRGSTGTQGPTGTTGSPAFGALLGRGIDVPAGATFLSPSGQSAADVNENNVSSFTPSATTTASDLAVTLTIGTGLTDTRTFTVRVGNTDTALTCTVPPGNTGCTSTKSVTIPGGSLISIGSTSTGTPLTTDARFGWRATS